MGKSRLVHVVKERVARDPHTRWEWRSSPYYHHTALYPLTEFLQRAVHWPQQETADARLDTLEQLLRQSRLPLEESVPLFASLLSLPVPAHRYPPLSLSPQRQRQKTLDSLVVLLVDLAAHQPLLFILEDLHWTDPTTLEWLAMLLEHIPTAPIYALLTGRPEFQPAWPQCSALTEVTVPRFSRDQIAQLATHVAGGKTLPAAIIAHLVDKTDGVPLYCEEITKGLLEAGHLQETNAHYEVVGTLPALAIPATLHDALMARLDRLLTAKGIAQLGATIGRQFSYALLRHVAQVEEDTLHRELRRLVGAELLYQQGLPPQATYTFKHALIQDAAYHSLLRAPGSSITSALRRCCKRSFPRPPRRTPNCWRITPPKRGAQNRPLAIGSGRPARPGSRSLPGSGPAPHPGLALLTTLPETPARAQQELALQLALGTALQATQGMAPRRWRSPFARARALCVQVGDTPQVVPALRGSVGFMRTEGSYPRRASLGSSCCGWRSSGPAHAPPGGV